VIRWRRPYLRGEGGRLLASAKGLRLACILCLVLVQAASLRPAAAKAALPTAAPRPAAGTDLTPSGQRAHGTWVAADPIRRRHLLVWLAGDRRRGFSVFTRLLDSEGRPLSDPREVGEGMTAGVGFDRATGRYLVAYVQVGIIWGRLLDAEGRILGDPFPIAAFWYARNSAAWRPVISSDGGGNFLVVWSDRHLSRSDTSTDVFFQFVSAAEGRPTGAARPALSATRRAEYLGWRSVVYDPFHGRFIAVWHTGDRQGLEYRFIYPDGRMSETRALGIRGLIPGVALDEKRKRLLLTWEDAEHREPRLRLFDLDFRPLAPEQRLPGRQKGVDLINAAFDPVSDRYIVTWRNDFDCCFFGQWVGPNGALIGKPFIAARLSGFRQLNFSLPRPGGGFLFFYEDFVTGPANAMHGVVRVRKLLPSAPQTPAYIKPHPAVQQSVTLTPPAN